MTEMIERVALAMWRQREATFPKFTQRMTPDNIDRSSGAWAAMLLQARAAIEAMREPTDAMTQAPTFNDMFGPCEAKECWQDMVDEALREPT